MVWHPLAEISESRSSTIYKATSMVKISIIQIVGTIPQPPLIRWLNQFRVENETIFRLVAIRFMVL
uniref:Uncharacterized protein n=1 Tax=Romanomermis culicivorax TaxID=13658 RepID=A0A915K5G2_ROMCU